MSGQGSSQSHYERRGSELDFQGREDDVDEYEEEGDEDERGSSAATSGGSHDGEMDDDGGPLGGMSIEVCGQPFQHRAQSARRRAVSARLSRSACGSVKLAGVKQELYNPALPSLRRMDMDEMQHHLTSEHSRATSALGRRSFSAGRTTYYQPVEHIPAKTIMDDRPPLETRLRALSASAPSRPLPWNSLIQSMQERQKPPTEPTAKWGISGYTSRHLHPGVSQSWRVSLRGVTGIDRRTHGQHLTPANINYRYRDSKPQYTQPPSTVPWH